MAETTPANEPPPIRQLSATELKALIESRTPFELVDVRTNEERSRGLRASLVGSGAHDALLRMDRDMRIVFQCHHGVRSQQLRSTSGAKDFAISTICGVALTNGLCSSMPPYRGTSRW